MWKALLLVLACCVSLAADAEVVRPRCVGEILPTPKRVSYEDTFLPLVADGRPLVSVLTNAEPDPGEASALVEIESMLGVKPPTAKDGDRCVISIGRTPAAQASLAKRPVDIRDEGFEREGYVLRFERGGGVEVRRAEITDWPTFLVRCFPMRGYSLERIRDEIDFRSRFKINGESFHYIQPYMPYPKPGEPQPPGLQLCMDSAQYARQTARIDIYEYANPYPWESEGQININSPEEVERLVRWFEAAVSAGAEGIMLCLDDTPREITYEELIRFRDMGYAHAYLYRQIYETLKPRCPDCLFLFLPVTYGGYPGNQQDKDYMNILAANLPHDVGFVWTGPGGQANRIDNADVDLISSYIGGRKPFFWDNSAGWVHKLSPGIHFLDPYRTKLAPDMAYRLFARGTHLLNPCDEVYYLTWADYVWNPEAYDAEKSWRKVLAMLGGEANVESLIEYNRLWTNVYRAFALGECLVDDTSQLDAAIRRMEEIAAKVSGDLPKGLGPRLPDEAAKARTKLTEWTTRMASVHNDCAEAEDRFRKAVSGAAAPTLKWRNTQGNGWTARPTSVGLSGKDVGHRCLLIDRDPVSFSSRADAITTEAEIALPREQGMALMLVIEDGDVRPLPGPDTKGHALDALLAKTIRLNGKVVWQSDPQRGPAAETVVLNVPKELAGKTATLSITVANNGWSPPRVGEKVCVLGPVMVRAGKMQVAKPKPSAEPKPLTTALEALKQLPPSFRSASYSRRSYSDLLESIVRDPALQSVESRIAEARGMWGDGRPDKAIECLLRKGEVVHARPGGRSSVTGISDNMSAETEAMLMRDRPVAFCRRATGAIKVDGAMDDWPGAEWSRLSETISPAVLDPWDPIKKFVNFCEDWTTPVIGVDGVERAGRERFVSFNPCFAESDTSARFAAAWDSRNLYLVADVTDDVLRNVDPDRTYGGDHVQFYIDALNDQTDLPWDDDVWYQVSILRNLNSSRGTGRFTRSKAVYKLAPKYRGYVVEMAIPWAEIGLVPYQGHRMGFDVRVRDRDSDRECKTIWWRAIKENRIDAVKRTFGWGELVLTAEAEGQGVR